MKNYADRGECYPPKSKAEANNTLRDLHNSSYHTKAEFNNYFIILSKYFQSFKNIRNVCKRARVSRGSDFKVNMQICWVHGKIARYLKTMNKKKEKNDQQVFGDENFIQVSDKFAVRSKTNEFLACTKPIQFPPRKKKIAQLWI